MKGGIVRIRQEETERISEQGGNLKLRARNDFPDQIRGKETERKRKKKDH